MRLFSLKISFVLLCAFLLAGCYSNVAQKGSLASTGDVYYLNIPSYPPSDLKVYIPVAEYEDFLTVDEYVDSELVIVSFGAGYKHENSVEFHIVPKHESFKKFVRRVEHLTVAEYKNMPNVQAKQIIRMKHA